MLAKRLPNNPIVYPEQCASIGENINGPSLIRVPDWVNKPLGRYYLYFAHHHGKYIRLAYADRLSGPWQVHEPGTLQIEQTSFQTHIASPDVHVNDQEQIIMMYFHGFSVSGTHQTHLAISSDGLDFEVLPEPLGPPYLRVFQWNGCAYAFGVRGKVFRSSDSGVKFNQSLDILSGNVRHTAVLLMDDILFVFYSMVADRPECILLSEIRLTDNWLDWRASLPQTVLEPEMAYEGANLPMEISDRGWAPEPVRQLRDPAIFQEDQNTYLLYSVAGERGIAIAQLESIAERMDKEII